MVGEKFKVKDLEGREYLLLEKYFAEEDGVFYEVYEYSYDETYGAYLGDFDTQEKIGSTEFVNELTEWLNN